RRGAGRGRRCAAARIARGARPPPAARPVVRRARTRSGPERGRRQDAVRPRAPPAARRARGERARAMSAGLCREDLLLLRDEPELVAIADAFRATQQGLRDELPGRRWRSSRPLAVAAAIVAVLAGLASVALARDLDLFAGAPAPPDVQKRFV